MPAAARALLALGSLTRTALAEPTTCALVTMSPWASKTTPEPSPRRGDLHYRGEHGRHEPLVLPLQRHRPASNRRGPGVGLALPAALTAAPPPPPQTVRPAAIASASPVLAWPGHLISRLHPASRSRDAVCAVMLVSFRQW